MIFQDNVQADKGDYSALLQLDNKTAGTDPVGSGGAGAVRPSAPSQARMLFLTVALRGLCNNPAYRAADWRVDPVANSALSPR